MTLGKQRVKILPLVLAGLAANGVLWAQVSSKNAAASKPAAAAPSAAGVEKGKTVFDSKCAICHFSASAAKKIGPSMKGLAKRGTYADGKTVDDVSLRAWIEKGGKNMPGLKESLTAEQVRDLIVYLKTL